MTPVDYGSIAAVCNYSLCMNPRMPGSQYCQVHRERSILLDSLGGEPYRMAPQDKSAQLDPHKAGVKLDGEKAPIYRGLIKYFPRALREVSKVSAYGADKYTWGGWATVPDGFDRYSDAEMRHLLDEIIEGEVNHKDGDLLHAAQHAWGALARLELMLRDREKHEKSGAMPGVSNAR